LEEKVDIKDENIKLNDSEITTFSDESLTSKKSKLISTNKNYKIMKCKVISYNKNSNILDILFNKYGIRIKDVKNFDNNLNTVNIQYKGEIGKPNFEYKL